LADTGACASREDPLPEALACFEAALAYFEAEYMPEGYRLASEGVARVRGRLGPDSS
jgi:hypothetical protein